MRMRNPFCLIINPLRKGILAVMASLALFFLSSPKGWVERKVLLLGSSRGIFFNRLLASIALNSVHTSVHREAARKETSKARFVLWKALYRERLTYLLR